MSDRELRRPSRDVEEGKREPVSEGESESASSAVPTTGEQALSEKTAPPAFVNDAPDGGTAAWLCVLGAWCTSFCSFGWLNSMGAFQEYYQTGPLSSYSASTVAWIPSLLIFFIFAMGPIVGKLYDSHGPRPLLLLGSFLHVFGIMMASISTKYYQFLLSQGVCSAIGVAFMFQPPIACIAGWFNKKRGAAYGILSTGSSIGGVIFPIMISRLIRTTGYGWSMRAGAFMILGLLVIANLTVTSRHPPQPKKMTKQLMVKPLKEPGFVIMLVGLFLLTFGIFVPINYIQIQAIEEGGMSPHLAQYILAILNAGSLFGRLLSGVAADKLGKFNVFAMACGTAGIFTLAMWIPATGNAALIVFAVIFGFTSGAYVSLIGGLVAQISPLPEIGFRTGLVFLFGSIGGLTTNPIAGQILETSSGWKGLKAFAGAFLLAGTAVVMVSRLFHTGWKLNAVF